MRSRNIKPAFFKNEDLSECEPLARILFIGLWCYADREGRFEWRPKKIKAEILPYDNIDINGYLTVLTQLDFIQKYNVNGKTYGRITKFKRHQHPHHTEKESELPDITKACEIPVKQPLSNGDNPSDSLIPDSLIPDSKEYETDIQNLSKELSQIIPRKQFNPFQFTNKNKKKHRGAIVHILNRLLKEAKGGFPDKVSWQYAQSVLDSEHQNYNANDAEKQGQKHKGNLAEIARMIEKNVKAEKMKEG